MRPIDADALFVDASFFNDELDRAERFYSEEQIKNAPTVDAVEVARGCWTLHNSKSGWVCSNCGERELRTTVYCPNCGAKMEKENEY